MYSFFRNTILAFLLFLSISVNAQQPGFRNYSVNEGLPSSEVFHIIQDSKGFIWFATNMGVSRFDGSKFKNFDVQDGLPENTVFEIFEDETGKIWFISFPFQLSYYKNDTIRPYKYNSILKTIAGHGLIPVKKSFNADKKGDIIFSFLNDGKLYKLNSIGELEVIEELKNSSSSISILELDKRIYAAQSGTRDIKNFNLKISTSKINTSLTIIKSFSKYTGGFYLMNLTKDDDLLFALNEILIHVKSDQSFNSHDLGNRILWISNDKDGSLWIGKEYTGVEKVDLNNNLKIKEKYLQGVSVSSVLIDNEDGLWCSSLGSGVFYLPSKAFLSYSQHDGLNGENVKCVEEFKNKIYLGYDDTFYLDRINNHKVAKLPDFGNDNNKIKALSTYKDSVLWIGTEKHLHSFNGSHFKKFLNTHPSITNSGVNSTYVFSIKDIYPISKNEVLLAQMRSLAVIRNNKVAYDSYYDDSIALRIEAITQETDSSFLLGTFNGLWRYTKNKLSLVEDGFPISERIPDLVVLPNGYVLGTKGFGIIVNVNNVLHRLTQLDGLSSNSITSMLIAGEKLWIATNNGLNAINISDLNSMSPNILVFKKEQGLISNEINQIKAYGDNIYIATNKGLTVFDRTKYKPLKNPPPIFIESVSVLRRTRKIKDLSDLSHKENFLSISYLGVNFRDAGNLKYKYRLLGLSNNFTFTNNLQVEYAFLPHGKYTFEVYAINLEGLESSQPATVSFVIAPPFWKTWWFYLMFTFITTTLVIAYIRNKSIIEQKENTLIGDINNFRQQSLARQMDPHFVFNTLNSIQAYIVKNDTESSANYLAKFSRLMRIILNNSQRSNIPLSLEMDSLASYLELESMRFNDGFLFSVTCDQELKGNTILVPPFVVQPFVENAIWHGIVKIKHKGKITVHFGLMGTKIRCVIEDNGIGRAKSINEKSTPEGNKISLGISLVKSRIGLLANLHSVPLDLMIDDVVDENNIVTGTRVTVDIPFQRNT